MKTINISLASVGLLLLFSCGQSAKQKAAEKKQLMEDSVSARKQRIETALIFQESADQPGHSRNSGWLCPDNIKMFPPVDITSWNKVRVVNGRLPTYEETKNGSSLIYYDINKTPDAKPYTMTLPKLASLFSSYTGKEEIVIVIQIVQTANDTVVGYRFLTGGNGTNDFRDFHFLTDNEIEKATENKNWETPLK